MLYNIKNNLHIICTFGFSKLFIYVSKIITNKINKIMAQVDDKQVMIVRQSSIKVAQDFLCCKKGTTYGMNELISTADLITEWVLNGKTDSIKLRATNLDKYLKEKKQ